MCMLKVKDDNLLAVEIGQPLPSAHWLHQVCQTHQTHLPLPKETVLPPKRYISLMFPPSPSLPLSLSPPPPFTRSHTHTHTHTHTHQAPISATTSQKRITPEGRLTFRGSTWLVPRLYLMLMSAKRNSPWTLFCPVLMRQERFDLSLRMWVYILNFLWIMWELAFTWIV